MLAEFIHSIASMARAASSTQIVRIPGMRRLLVRSGDKVETIDLPPVRRRATFDSFSDVVNLSLDKAVCPEPEIYVGEDSIFVFTDRNSRTEAVRMRLQVSHPFAAMEALARSLTGSGFTPKALIRHLRFELPLPGFAPLLKSLAKVDFARRSDGKQTVSHGRESLGRQVEAVVQGVEQIPETVHVTCPVFANGGLREMSEAEIEVGVFIDVDKETIELRPIAGELEMAQRTAVGRIAAELRAALPDVPVFTGEPGVPLDCGVSEADED